jgi:hypothetical protein
MAQRIIERSHVGEVLQQIYTSGLNLRITLFSEGGYFYIRHAEKKTPLRGTSIEEAVTDLASLLAREYPESSFSEWWRMNFGDENTHGRNGNR